MQDKQDKDTSMDDAQRVQENTEKIFAWAMNVCVVCVVQQGQKGKTRTNK